LETVQLGIFDLARGTLHGVGEGFDLSHIIDRIMNDEIEGVWRVRFGIGLFK
jgi:hypothetical protein